MLLLFFFYFHLFFTLKSDTAAEKIATSTGKFSCVAANISPAVSTLMSLISFLFLD